MRYILAIAFLLLCCDQGDAQTIINQYAAVQGHTGCDNTFLVDDATGFGTGDTVLMIQMKGATIDSTNTASFGNITAYNGAGNYELNVVQSVAGNAVTLRYTVVRTYDIPAGKVQFVRVACYPSYTVSAQHSCLAWNGSKGGVFAIRVSGTLTMNADIDVSGKGFEGATSQFTYSSVSPCGTDYRQGINVDSSAKKGEGITAVGANKAYGRGKLANGGGGGNGHNSGGAGGSNSGRGGDGGYAFWGCNGNSISTPATNNQGGIPGAALSYSASANKIFLGGGGGGGHANNYTDAAGGAGGGLVVIMAGTISGGGKNILATGANAPGCTSITGVAPCNDGMGGGGGGGAVMIQATGISGNLAINCKGGAGANVTTTNNPTLYYELYGPGGGGGGGVCWISSGSLPSGTTVNAAGGPCGINVNQSNKTWGATPGATGATLTGLSIPLPTIPFVSNLVTAAFSDSIVSCNTVQFINRSTAIAGIASYQWSFGPGAASTLRDPQHTFASSGTYAVSLTVTDINGCTGMVTRNIIVPPSLPVSFTDSLVSCLTRKLVNTTPAAGVASYSWDFGTGAASTTRSPLYTFPGPGVYTVKLSVIDSRGCVSSVSRVLTVRSGVKADFTFYPATPEVDKAVQFTNISTGATRYSWAFGDGGGSNEVNPAHTYRTTSTMRVCLYAEDDAGCADTACKTLAVDIATSIGVPSAFSPNDDGVNDVLLVKGAGIQQMRFIIFNRWGQKVFESASQAMGWDGTFKGQQQEIDLYAYILTATFYNGKSVTKKGNINLLR